MSSAVVKLDIQAIREIANKPIKDTGYTRQFYSYPAKFQHRLPRYLIEALTSPGDLVVDPYSGGGTTALESLLLGRNFAGYDLNGLAITISRVKTTRLSPSTLSDLLVAVLQGRSRKSPINYFDDVDIECIGDSNAKRATQIAEAIWEIRDRRHREFFLVALIHALKILGRRDYDEGAITEDGDDGNGKKGNGKNKEEPSALALFEYEAPEQIASMFMRKARRMIEELQSLPSKPSSSIQIVARSNHDMREVGNGESDLIVTSPPYKDLDVEYALLQFQRRSLNRSKRTTVIERILRLEKPPTKNALCGEKGEAYWDNIRPTFSECARIARKDSYAFFWTGFKTQDDHDGFVRELEVAGFRLVENMAVTLGNDRVASSRSTHHDRDTGMLAKDYLIITQRV